MLARSDLESLQHRVTEVDCGDRAKQLLDETTFDVAFLSQRLCVEPGLELLPELLRIAPGLNVIVIAADPAIETAVEVMRLGRLSTTCENRSRRSNFNRCCIGRFAARRLQSKTESFEQQVRAVAPEALLRSDEPAMCRTLEMAFKVAASKATLLLRGESGTGKGVLARVIHARSERAAGPFVTVYCPSLSAGLLQSELFGHVRGAFTGAVHDTLGKVTAAQGGTLFLDEIGDLPFALQPQLLRLLQENRYEQVGALQTRECDIRLLAATHRDLNARVAGGVFREDLLHRLNVIEIILPALRERPADIPLLATHFLQLFSRQSAKPMSGFTQEALAAIQCYRWPGNVRELRNAIERAVILASTDLIGLADLPTQISAALSGALA